MKKMYNFKQTTEIVKEKIGYNISISAMHSYRRLGWIKPAKAECVEEMNRTIFLYDDKSINDFVELYFEKVKSGEIRRFKKNKIKS
jgi:hypothetical protein